MPPEEELTEEELTKEELIQRVLLFSGKSEKERMIDSILAFQKERKEPAHEFASQFAGALVDLPLGAAKIAEEYESQAAQIPGMIGRAAGLPTPLEGMKKFLGLPSIEEMREDIPFISQEEPYSLAGHAGQIGGLAAGLAAPVGLAAGVVGRAPAAIGNEKLITRARKFVQNLISGVGTTFKAAPTTVTAIEGGVGAVAGAGGFLAEKKFPDTFGARFAGEMLGGMVPGTALGAGISLIKGVGQLSLYMPTVRWFVGKGKDIVKQAVEASTLRGTAIRVKQRLERAGVDPIIAKSGLEEDVLPGLTPAQRAEVPGLLSLEKAVLNSSEKLTTQANEQISFMNQMIRDSLEDIQTGEPLKTEEAFAASQQYFKALLDSRINIAAQRTNEKLSQIAPKTSPETVNRIASKEIEEAFSAAKRQENELYDLIPMEALAPTDATRSTLQEIIKETSSAQRGDIPAVAKRLLLDDRVDGGLGSITSIKELRGLQSKLRELARVSRSAKNFNKARIADNIANSITEDLSKTMGGEEVVEAVQLAVAFSKQMRDRFSKGTIGQLRGFTKEGGAKIPEGLSLDYLLGKTAGKARESYDDIIKAFDSPEAPDPEGVKTAVNDWLLNRFFRSPAIEKGIINPDKANTFLLRNEELLKRLPETKGQIEEAINLGNITALRERQKSRVKFNDPKISKATMFIHKGPEKAFNSVFSSKNPATEMQKLVNLAKKDYTGSALKGLKASFVDNVIKNASETALDIGGLPFLSGKKLSNIFDNDITQKVLKRLFADDLGALNRFDKIVNTAVKLEGARTAKEVKEGIIGDVPGFIAQNLAAVMGAAYGRRVGRALGAGGTVQIPGRFSSAFQKLLAGGVADPAQRLLSDAIQDEKLFRDLLNIKIPPKGPVAEKFKKRLGAWVNAVLLEQGSDYYEENRPQEAQPPQSLPPGNIEPQNDIQPPQRQPVPGELMANGS